MRGWGDRGLQIKQRTIMNSVRGKKLNPALSSSIKPLYHFICQQKEKEGKKHLNICPFRKPLCYICQNEKKIKEGGGGDLRAFYAF